MKKIIIIILACILSLILFIPTVSAHVPYIEYKDYEEERPYFIWKMIEYSKAFYAWLEHDGVNPSEDIDAFKFIIGNQPKNIYIELIVPVINDYYEDFVPWFAIVGPGLPEPNQTLPFDIPPGYGVIVKENVPPGTERETFYEPFGGKSYYEGPIFDENINKPGTYYVYVWDPHEQGGDYVLVVGKGEFFGPIDIIRSLINSIVIRLNWEIHISYYNKINLIRKL